MALVPRWFKRLKEFRAFSISFYVQKSLNVNYSDSSAMDILGSLYCLMSFSSHFSFFVFVDEVTKNKNRLKDFLYDARQGKAGKTKRKNNRQPKRKTKNGMKSSKVNKFFSVFGLNLIKSDMAQKKFIWASARELGIGAIHKRRRNILRGSEVSNFDVARY